MTATRSDPRQRAAVIAGVLFITATATNVVGTGLSRSLLDSPGYLGQVAADANRVTTGALLELVAAAASAGIAVALYPVLKSKGPGLALGSVVFRTIEAVMYVMAVVGLLSVLALSRRYLQAGPAVRASIQASADAMLNLRQQAGLISVFAFGLGGLMYYALFYRSRLIPRWLSGWGLLAIIVLLAVWLVALFSHQPMTTYTVLVLPLGVQEIVLAVWLIAKGFNQDALIPAGDEEQHALAT
ncbi:MAG TPA: DUF4386 domain-containing protein [Kineosporiaceae bacterium]|nr:DUF4386 domain-containing protein [Kineosporiaceae bacterium]